jgi:AraC-like DNA-binding protein/mannose-6-phosphate isomerase-like protein (cupin superfamily)
MVGGDRRPRQCQTGSKEWQNRLRRPGGPGESIQVALSHAAAGWHCPGVALYVWQQALEPEFPLAVIEYATGSDPDRMHWHDHLEIAVVLDGRGAFLFGQRALPAEAGDIFFIDNSQPHVALADLGTPLRLLLVLFRPELIAGPGCRELDLGYLAPFRFDERAASPRIDGGSRLAAELRPVLSELMVTWRRHDPAERHLVDATLRRALALVNRDRGADSTAAAARVATGRREQIRPVLAYVDLHCPESITLEDVAQVVHVSPSRLRHVFKEVTGFGFKEYVTQVRVAEAKRLLLGSDLSVAEIARQVSYTNLYQFYKVFYRSCAMSPGEYRRYYTPTVREGAAAAEGG